MTDASEVVTQAITSRKSTRGFLPKQIDPAIVDRLLRVAGTAPSGSNIQPWKVHVITGAARDRLSAELVRAHDDRLPEQREYQYYPVDWRSPYLERRRQTGWGLYQSLGIAKGDREATFRQHRRNFEFFGAPLVLIFTIDADLGTGSWLDYGMFLQSIMIAARGFGLHSCPQAALANYPAIVKRQLDIGADQILVCGISIGYEDQADVVTAYRPPRINRDDFVIRHDH